LYTSGDFARQVKETFEGDYKLRFHLAPPLFAKRDARGHLVKRQYGPWMLRAFGLLARLRRLRGSWLDPFGKTAERRQERRLLADYEALLAEVARDLTPEKHATAVALLSVPEKIRGYGHVKEAHIARAKPEEHQLLATFRGKSPQRAAAE
ncbi:MAG TPA: DUF6537 domain-containing protein, partial [Kiloniellales bacterium]|nr:DUF6537 domain-containing protein [Kiloniellales bacterium]